MSESIAISLKNITKTYRLYDSHTDRVKETFHPFRKKYHYPFNALSNVSFNVKRGETVGIIGRNGSGKSTLLQIICGILQPTAGSVEVNGRVSALLELGAGFNPEFTGRENVYLNGTILGLTSGEIDARFNEIREFAEIGDFIDQPVRTYSTGMYVRLAFAVAINVDPDILIVDEVLAVGDEAFQRKCFSRIQDIQKSGGTIIFVSHSAQAVVELCNRAIFLNQGELLLSGKPKAVVSQYQKFLSASQKTAEKLVKSFKFKPKIDEDYDDIDKNNTQLERVDGSHYDPALRPKSTLSYEQRGAIISNVRLVNEIGNLVNILARQKTYFYRYHVKFTEDSYDVLFAMAIKTLSGVELGGARSLEQKSDLRFVHAGSEYDIEFEFQSLLTPGTYFFNAGVEGQGPSERFYLHRLVDALMVKVQPELDMVPTGIVDFLVKPSVRHCNESFHYE